MNFKEILMIPASLALAAGIAAAQSETPAPDATRHLVATYRLGGDGGWDLLSVDAIARRLYIARANRVMIVDADTGKLIGEIPGSGVHGVAVVSEVGRGFITNGKEDTVTIFDLNSLAVVGHAKTGKKPDAIIYDSASRHVFVCNNGDTSLTVLAPSDGTVEATIDVGGAPELVAIDGHGRLYTNLEDKNELCAVDTVGFKVLSHWSLAPGEGPSGVAVDAKHHRVFSVCHDTRTMIALDTDTGKVVASLAIGSGADGAVFDQDADDVLIPNGDGTLSVIHESSPDAFTVQPPVPTKAYARTIAMDDKTHRLFLVTADPKPSADGEKPKGRPQFLPDSFEVLVIGK